MLIDLLGGHVSAAFDNLPSSIEHIRSGKLRALAVTTAKRLDALPNVPTLAGKPPGYEAVHGLALAHCRTGGYHRQTEQRDQRQAMDKQLTVPLKSVVALPGSAADFAS